MTIPETMGQKSSDPMQTHRPQIEAFGLSDLGCRRTNNEDSFVYDLETNIYVVCDGMGGMAAGEIASNLAVQETLQRYRSLCSQNLSLEERLQAAITDANDAVWNLSAIHSKFRGMGTTLVAAGIHESQVVIANVGDSRAYLLRGGGCLQITEDHSYCPQQNTPEMDVSQNPQAQSLITRAVGVDATVTADLFSAEMQTGDIILLATDGLTRYVTPEEIANLVYRHNSLEQISRSFIELCHARGGADNVTCLLLRAL
jgi:protein phosphatase